MGFWDIAGKIAKAGWGENASILKSFKALGEEAAFESAAARRSLLNQADDIIKKVNIDELAKGRAAYYAANAAGRAEAGLVGETEEALAKEIKDKLSGAIGGMRKGQTAEQFGKNLDFVHKEFGLGALSGEGGKYLKGGADAVESFTESVGVFKNNMNKYASNDYLGVLGKTSEKGIGFKNMMGGMFYDPLDGMGAARRHTAEVVGGTALIAGRYASGGSLTRNNRGESDIVGIPFI